MVEAEIAEVGAFQQPDPRIGAQLSCQLTAADIDRNNLPAPTFQQDLSETPGRGTGVESAAGDAESQII
jgi:hypothetical protein